MQLSIFGSICVRVVPELRRVSLNGEALSRTGVPQIGVELPLRPPIDSKEPRVLKEVCLFKVPLLELESSVELDFLLLCLRVRVPKGKELIDLFTKKSSSLCTSICIRNWTRRDSY